MIAAKEKYKILVIGIFLAGCLALVYYFHAVVHTDTLFTHSYYIPIVLSALWWKRKALTVAVFSAVLLICSHLFYLGVWRIVNGCFRALMFIVVSIIVAEISGKMAKMQEEIEKERNFSENIIDTLPDSLLILDKDLRIRKATRTFCEKLQKDPDKVIGKSLYNVLQDKDGKISSELSKIFKKKNIFKYFKVYYHLEGQPGKRVFSISTIRMLGEKLLIIWDITERFRGEEKLRCTLKTVKKHRRDLRRLSNKLIIVQEALTNIAKHAQANNVYLCLKQEDSKVWVFIEDDGKGFDVEEVINCEDPNHGVGLLGIRERIAPLKGSFSVQSHPGQGGTQLSIEIPWKGGL